MDRKKNPASRRFMSAQRHMQGSENGSSVARSHRKKKSHWAEKGRGKAADILLAQPFTGSETTIFEGKLGMSSEALSKTFSNLQRREGPHKSFNYGPKRHRKSATSMADPQSRERNKLALNRIAQKVRRHLPGQPDRRGSGLSNDASNPVVLLDRGGVYVQTTIGPIQFGIPPETIKDCLHKGYDVPSHFVIPKERFNLNLGVTCAEIEFPMFFNFFVLRRIVNLITDEETSKQIDIVVRECTIGPEKDCLYAELEYKGDNPDCLPDHQKEINHFKVEGKMLGYTFFDEKRLVTLRPNDKEASEDQKVILFDNQEDFRYELFDFAKYKNDPNYAYFKEKYGEDDIYKLFFDLKESGHWMILKTSFHIISYDDAENIGNIYFEFEDENDGAVIAQDVNTSEDYDITVEDLAEFGGRENKPKPAAGVKQKKTAFEIPMFGLTILGNSHGFDPNGTTTGFVVWVNGQGIMVDPPPHSSNVLKKYGIQPKSISAIILTHCHADHDAGTFQKMITDHKVDLMTSATIYNSFVRKYSAVSGLSKEFLETLFNFKPVILGEPNYWKGAVFNFFYSLHAIPCVGFRIDFKGQSMVYSADTFYDPPGLLALRDKGVLSEGRAKALIDFPFDCDVVLHEAGVPPIHTPIKAFCELSPEQQKNIHLIHIAGKEAKEAKEKGFKIAQPGVANTIERIGPSKDDQGIMKWLQIVSKMEIFEHFSVEKTLELLYMANLVHYPAGSVIQDGMSPLRKFMIVISGKGVAEISDSELTLAEGDFFGELIFVDPEAVEEVIQFDEAESEKDADESASQVAELKSERFEAMTDMKILELDYYAIKNLLSMDESLKSKMEKIVGARQSNFGWTTMNSNSILSKLRLGQKLELQTIMEKVVVAKGETLSTTVAGKRYKWEKGKVVKFAVLIESGSLVVEETTPDAFGNTEATRLENGLLIFEYLNFSQGLKHEFTLKASDYEEAFVYVIDAERFEKFLATNPHLLLSFFKSEVVFKI